jgi:2-keto-4-pentenoate hydratase/2-oxohepta-3-ene-1,7-dioic acid hydratase in catechol pathway
VDGVQRQKSRTSNMIFSVPTIISQLSLEMTLYPGDIIMTGTPEGVGFAMSPPACLRSGNVIEATIEGIGTLRNSVE